MECAELLLKQRMWADMCARESDNCSGRVVWRPGIIERIVALGVAIGFGAIWISVLASGIKLVSGDVALLIFFAVGSVVFALYSVFTYISLDSGFLIVRNLGHRKRISLCEVTSVRSGYYGMEIHRTGGKWWHALAVQKPRWAFYLGKKTRSDAVEEAIMYAVSQASGGDCSRGS